MFFYQKVLIMQNTVIKIGNFVYEFILVKDYVDKYVNKNISFVDKIFGFNFNVISNCFSIGNDAQLLIPILKRGNSIKIFLESFTFNHSKVELANILINNFLDQECIQVDEAAPLYHLYSNNFWHWTIECIPKIIALENIGFQGKYIVFNSKFILEILDLFGIAKERILFAGKNYIVKQLIVSPNYNYFHTFTNVNILKILRSCILERIPLLSGSKNIYVKRISGRIVNNDEEIQSILKKYDFEILIPEEHSVLEQFSTMTNVDFSVMAHGANGALILTQKPMSCFMEFFSSAYVVYHTTGIIDLLKLEYIPLVEFRDKPPIVTNHHNGQFCNIDVPAKQFEVILSNCLYRRNKYSL